ncbi:MAG: c-type cytochrome [Hyphomicrobium sp.]|jgi:mono/diheme cytochrome c family protein|nr:c-type cytochrome [Hyphomicrobium sp.]
MHAHGKCKHLVSVAFALALSAAALPARADSGAAAIEAGGRTFMRYCALCHGLDGTGNGPLTESLLTAPPDLTTLAARNDGNFPEARVKEIIEKGGPKGHGMMEMLAWGKVFNEEVGSDSHKVIDELSAYLAGLQKR